MSNMCLIPTPQIRELANKIRQAYPEASNRNNFNDQMCAEWIGVYNAAHSQSLDNVPSMKSLVNYIEKLRNNEGKSFLRNLNEEFIQMSVEPAQTQITYNLPGQKQQTYTINGTHIYNKDGKEVFAADDPNSKTHRFRIFANLAVKQGRAVVIEYKGRKYVVNNENKIMSASGDKPGHIMNWDDNNGDRKAVLALAQAEFDKKSSSTTSTTDEISRSTTNQILAHLREIGIPVHNREELIQYLKDRGYKNIQQALEEQDEMRSIREQAIANGQIVLKSDGSFDYALAPNGEKSKLNERQWLQVRTKAFKKWFGDWENDPTNVSKVIDENGEPLVVYRGGNISNGELETRNGGYYFSPSKEYASKYTEMEGGETHAFFLNIKDINNIRGTTPIIRSDGKKVSSRGLFENPFNKEDINILLNGKDGAYSEGEYLVSNPTQIKSATANSGAFDGSNPDIQMAYGRFVDKYSLPKGELPILSNALSEKYGNKTAYGDVIYTADYEYTVIYRGVEDFDIIEYHPINNEKNEKITNKEREGVRGSLDRVSSRDEITQRKYPSDNYHVTDGKAIGNNVGLDSSTPQGESQQTSDNVGSEEHQGWVAIKHDSITGRVSFVKDGRTIDSENSFVDNSIETYTTPQGEIYAFASREGDIYADEDVIRPEHLIHEYTHLWDRALAHNNPKLWKKGVELMKQLDLWKQIEDSDEYSQYGRKWKAEGRSAKQIEFLIASEVHSRLVGKGGEKLLNQIAKEQKGAEGIIARLKRWILEAWKDLKSTFGEWTDEDMKVFEGDVDTAFKYFNRLTIRDFATGINPNTITSQQSQSQQSPVFDISKAEFYSGGAMGSDKAWAAAAKKLGIKVQEYTVADWDKLSQDLKDKYDAEYKSVALMIGRNPIDDNTYSGKLVRRDMMQADNADAVFAIGTVDSHGYVSGGTGYATGRGIQRGIPVYLYDRKDKQWKVWDSAANKFTPTAEPTLTPHAAVIGTRGDIVGKTEKGYDIRDINDEEKQVINSILAKSVGTQTSQPVTPFTTPSADAEEGAEGGSLGLMNLLTPEKNNPPKPSVTPIRRPISPSFETALKTPSSEQKEFYNAFSPTQIVDRARMITSMFSDIIDDTIYDRREYYQDIIDDSNSSEEDRENAKASLETFNDPILARVAAVDFKTYSVIMDEIKNRLTANAEAAVDSVIKQKYDNSVKYFDFLANEAAKWIEEEEGIRKGNNKTAEEEEQEGQDFGDNDSGNASNGNDGWSFKEKFNNPFRALSKQVRRVLGGIETGEKDDLGNNKTYSQTFIYATLMSYLSKNLEYADDFIQVTQVNDYTDEMKDIEGLSVTEELYPNGYPIFPALEQMRDKYAWAGQVISRLTKDYRARDNEDEDGTELKFPHTFGTLASQFYTNFRKVFIPYAKVQVGIDPKTGKAHFGTTALNYDMENRSQRDELENSYNNGITYSDDSLYNTDKSLNIENAKKVESALLKIVDSDIIDNMYKAFNDNKVRGYDIAKEYTDQANEILTLIRAFGINASKDNVSSLLLQDADGAILKGMLSDLRAIATQVKGLTSDKNYFVDIVNKYGNSVWDSFFAGRGFVTEVNMMQSFYDPASKKTLYSYSADNYLQRTMRFLFSGNISKEKRQKYLNEHFGVYEWFRDQSYPEGQGWKSLWLESAYNATDLSDVLPYKNINNVEYTLPDGTHEVHPYTDWDSSDIYRVMLRSWDTNSGDFAYYLSPIFADSPMSMTVRGPKYSMNQLVYGATDEYGRHVESGFVRLIDQELQRIKYIKEIRAKAIKDGTVLPITNYEKNGRKFCFMPELNAEIFGPEGNMSFDVYVKYLEDGYDASENKSAGSLDEIIRNAEIEAITAVLEHRYHEFLNQMPRDVLSEVSKGLEKPEDLEDVLRVPYYNMVYAETQIIELTTVDTAFYKNATDFQKRFKEVYASGGRLNTNSRYGKKFENVILIADDMVTSRSYNSIKKVVDAAGSRMNEADRNHILKSFAFLKDENHNWDGINVSDAQALRSLDSYRSILDMMGKWDDRLGAAFGRIKNGTWNRNDFDIILQTIKPFVYSVISKNDGAGGQIAVPVQHKNSELVLLAMYDMICGSLKNSARLRGVQRFLEKTKDAEGNPIGDMIQYQSAGKSGNQGVININYSHSKVLDVVNNGSIELVDDKGITTDTIFLDSDFLDNTRENSADNFDKIKSELTQMLIDEKISQETFNAAIEYFEPTEDEVVEILETYTTVKDDKGNIISANPERVQKVPYEDYMLAQPTPAHHMDTTVPQGSQERNIIVADLPDGFKLTLDGKDSTTKNASNEYDKNGVIDFYYKLIVENLLQDYASLKEVFKDNVSLRDRVMELAQSSPTYGRDFAEAFSLDSDGNFVLSPNSPTIFRKVQQLVNSIIKNKIAVQKVNGAALIQASGIGLSDDLHIVFDANDKPVGAECYLPATSKDFFDAFTVKKRINGQLVDALDIKALQEAKLDKAVGFRIPTENKSSMLPIIIKGFSPQQNGSSIFLPAEITALSGSDFDVDKMFVMLSDFYVQRYNMRKAREDFAKSNKMFEELLGGLVKAGELSEADMDDENIEELNNDAFKAWWKTNSSRYQLKKPRIRIIEYDFSKTPKRNGRRARNTMLVQIMYKILTSQEGAENLFNPQHFDGVIEASKMNKIMHDDSLLQKYMQKYSLTKDDVIDHLLNASNEDLVDFVKKNDVERSPIYPQTFNYFHHQNMAGNALLAMFALQVSAAAKFQRANITIKEKNQFTIDGKKIKDVDKIFNEFGEHRLKNVSQFVGACADNGKDPNVTDYGATRQNAKVIAYLLRAGLTIKQAMLIINQPVMELPMWAIRKYIGTKRSEWRDTNISSHTLAKAILQPDKVSEENHKAIAIMCYKVLEQANALAELTNISRADSPNGGIQETFAKARLYKYKVDLFNGRQNSFDYPFNRITEAISNDKINLNGTEDEIRAQLLAQKMSMLQGFYSLGVQSFDKLLSPYFFMLNKDFDNLVVKKILDHLPPTMSDDQKEKVLEALYSDYITYSLSSFNLFGDETDESTMKGKREYYTKVFPGEYISILAANKEIRDKIGNLITLSDAGRLVLKDGGQLMKGQRDEVLRRITGLLYSTNPENPETQKVSEKLAKDLFIYSYFDNGLQFTKDSFSVMFSTQFCTSIDGYNEFLQNLGSNLTAGNAGRFIRQFYNNHPEIALDIDKKVKHSGFVRDDRIIINKHNNHNFDNPMDAGLRPYAFIKKDDTLYILESFNYDTITYVPIVRYGDSNKIYNNRKTPAQMASDYPYIPMTDSGEEVQYGYANDPLYNANNPDFNDFNDSRAQLPVENNNTNTGGDASTQESDGTVSDRYDASGKSQIAPMC